MILGVLTAGEYFGEMGLVDGQLRSASVITLEPTQTLSLDRLTFVTFLQETPAALMNILRALCERLRFADRRIEDLATLDLAGRLTHILEEVGAKEGDKIPGGIVLPQYVTHQELSAMVGATRARVTKTLTFLRKRGIVRRHMGRLVIRTKTVETRLT